MGMHTIRWRSGATDSGQIPCLPMLGLRQCALSPFSSLLLSAESLSEYRSSAWRLPLCQDAVRISMDGTYLADPDFEWGRRSRRPSTGAAKCAPSAGVPGRPRSWGPGVAHFV